MKEKIIYENDDVVIVMRSKEKKQKYSEEKNDYGIVHSMYARFFDESVEDHFTGWREYDERFINEVEHCVNIRLHDEGYLFLNSVYKELGLPETVAGETVGWFDGLESDGDGYVKFDLHPVYVNGIYRGLVIDFNVDGEILTKLKGESK